MFEEEIFTNEFIQDSSTNELLSYATIRDIKMIRFCTSEQLRLDHKNSTKIYSDNGGSFYKYKIDEQFLNNEVLINKLRRYQISPTLNDSMFEINCLVHAMIQTNQFNQKTINQMKAICHGRYISRKELDSFGNHFGINFKVVKYREDHNRWDNITGNNKKIIGDKDGIVIELAIIEKHYVLNEIVEGVSSFALLNYIEINQKYNNRSDEEKLQFVGRRNNGNLYIKRTVVHIRSYELIRLISLSKREWNFEELVHLNNDLYTEVLNNIEDISAIEDKDIRLYKPPGLMDTSDEIYYADVECDTSKEHEAYCI